jgi:nucleotide-binding universal stress UspA family protein
MTPRSEAKEPETQTKILIPVGKLVSKGLITQALHVLSTFKDPLIVLFHVVEIPSRTSTLDPELYRLQIDESERILNELATWLIQQGLKVRIKVAVARSAADGIVEETERDGYLIVFLMKRKTTKGWRRYFARSVSEKVVRHSNCLVLTAPLGHLSSHSDESSKH